MTTEKIRVSASSVIRSVHDTSATPSRWRADGVVFVVGIRVSVPSVDRMVRGLTAFRRAFIAASLVWVVALPLATYAAAQPHASPATYLFALAVYLIGRAVCHQIAERSFELWRHQMPVCARCTGIY